MSTVILDTITGKSTATTITIGSTPVVSASANSMTIRGEGSAQTSIQQGLAKVWVNVQQASSYSTRDSFNLSSHGDQGTGKSRLTFTTSFGDANHSASGIASNLNNFLGNDNGGHEQTSSTIQVATYDASNAIQDGVYVTVSIHGDLA